MSIPFCGIFSIAVQIALCRLYSYMLHRIFTLLLIGIACQLYAQPYIDNVPKAFFSINEYPYTLDFRSDIKGLNGGHLQGVQMHRTNSDNDVYNIVATASSVSHAYYVCAKVSGINSTQRLLKSIHINSTELKASTDIHIIDSLPYRHAGGCQLSGDVMAVGIEDNMAKDKAKVALINVNDNNSIIVVNRRGTFERSTAGAVAYIRLKTDQYLIAVGDWDTKNIDFYQSKPSNVAAFDSIATYKADTISAWGSYQSINLIQQADGKLYMIGFCLDAKGSRADLFSLTLEGGAKLQVVASRYFKTEKGVSFRYGAGIDITEDKKMVILACQRTLRKGRNYINAWYK